MTADPVDSVELERVEVPLESLEARIGRAHMELLKLAGYTADTRSHYTSHKFHLSNDEREWLKLAAARAARPEREGTDG